MTRLSEVVCVIPITKGEWITTASEEWEGLYFAEFVIDWSLFKDCKGKLYVETMHANSLKPPKCGWLRVAYQQEPAKFIPVNGSEIETWQKGPARWQLLESDWFKIPDESGVSCVWIQGKTKKGHECSLALATLVIAK